MEKGTSMPSHSSTILRWMDAALKRHDDELRKELCVMRDIMDGILDEYPAYVQKHIPLIIEELKKFNQDDARFIEIRGTFYKKIGRESL